MVERGDPLNWNRRKRDVFADYGFDGGWFRPPYEAKDDFPRNGGLAPQHRMGTMTQNAVAIARASYQAYVDNDRQAIEALISEDFSFTSPLDNRLDRATYFSRCWPNSRVIAGFEFIHLVPAGDRVFVTYEGKTTSGARFRNTEIVSVQDGKIKSVEVYFGWDIPHEAPKGSFVEAKSR